MADRRTRKMVKLAIEETSGVDHPAHLHEGWLVMKSAGNDEVLQELAPAENEAWQDASPSTDDQEGLMEKTTEDRLNDALEALAKAEDRIADMEKAIELPVSEDDNDMLKAAPEAVRKAFEEMEKQTQDAVAKAAAAEEALRKERDDRADAESVEKARTAFTHLGLDAAAVGPALRRLAAADESLAKAVETALVAANAKVESADIFSEIGSSTTYAAGSTFSKAESMAKAAVADGTAATFEQALSDTFLSDPSLYNEYLAEKKG